MEQILLSPIPLNELLERISSLVDERLNPFLLSRSKSTIDEDKFLSRKEVSIQLKISLPTLNVLTKQGTLTGYRMGRRVLYKKDEVESALEQIVVTKYKRKDLA